LEPEQSLASDREGQSDGDDRRVIVIGSGPCGAVAAATLIAAGIPVTMLESGQAFPGGMLVRVKGRNVFRLRAPAEKRSAFFATADPSAQWFQVLAPGGLSNYWTGVVPRFAPEDFTEGEHLHERYRWPVTYDDLAPFYTRVERLHGVAGASDDLPALPAPGVRRVVRLPTEWRRIAVQAGALGRGLAPAPMAEKAPWLITRSSEAFNSFHLVRRLQRSRYFDLRLGAHALRLEWDGAKRLVMAVTFFDQAIGRERRLNGAAVVVAAGALESTRLLFNSTCPDFAHGLGNTEGLLGRYLHDHLNDVCSLEVERALPRLGHPATLTRAAYDHRDPLLAASCTIGNQRMSLADRVLHLTPLPARAFTVVVFGTMIPTEDNHVALDFRSRDAFGLPYLDLHIRFDERALQNVARTRDCVSSLLESAGYRCRIRSLLPALVPGASVHYGGTVRMHASPRYGVLDGWNRMHAARNVVVADASAFTTGPEKGPTLTAMALSVRAAERLADDVKRGWPRAVVSAAGRLS
jgi:choline dehydrogenase-like flavoprotein